MIRILFLVLTLLNPLVVSAKGSSVFGLGIYDVKFDGSNQHDTLDLRYELRLDKSILDIGPEEDNFFFLKPFFGAEFTSDSAYYLLTGIYIEDNLGQLIDGEKNKFYFTPSFGGGFYDDGSGKNLGNDLQFRTSFEVSYELKNTNRIGVSWSHISNANIGESNPGVEVLSFSYHIPF